MQIVSQNFNSFTLKIGKKKTWFSLITQDPKEEKKNSLECKKTRGKGKRRDWYFYNQGCQFNSKLRELILIFLLNKKALNTF